MRKSYHELDDVDLARICHEAHLALRIGLNDSADDTHFDALPQERKQVVINQVRLFREGKSLAEAHWAWVTWMRSQGWKPQRPMNDKDPARKLHPGMVPWEELPVAEQAKVRQAQRIVFTHVMPDVLEKIAYRDIRSRPELPGDVELEELPAVCMTHKQFVPCAEEGRHCAYSEAAEDVDQVYKDRYER